MSANRPVSARSRALVRLLRIEEEGAYAALTGSGDTDADDAREERQAAEYVGGITRQRRRLDHLIGAFYRGNADKLDPEVRQILRIGLYDLTVLETPPHAAVHEAVELAKGRAPRASGLVNGILRNVQRQRHALPAPETGDTADDLAVEASVPTWIARRWLDRYGEADARALLAAANARPSYALRVNTLRIAPEAFGARLEEIGVACAPSRYLPDFVTVEQLQPVLRAGWLEDGLCAVQDEAAGLVVHLLDPQPGETIADVAAAPGGKALYAALRMGDRGRVLAFDVHPGRADLVRQSAEAHGLRSVEAAAADLRELSGRSDRPQADRVLLDAPCSGLGVLAKRADLRWRRSEEEIGELSTLQAELFSAAAALVRPGGLLVYSTCTLEPEENAERVQAFLEEHPEFTLESAQGHVPGGMTTPEGFYLALPHLHGTDGAFGARLRKR